MISAVVLAAGEARRFGQPKLLLKIGSKSLLRRVVEAALASRVDEVIVVLGYQASRHRQELASYDKIVIVESPDYALGQSTSLKAGLKAVSKKAEVAIILLADQPMVDAGLINALIDKHLETGKPLVVPFFAGKRGNPVLFHRSLFPELLAVEGDVGGREVVKRHKDELATLNLPQSLAWWDIDSPEDYDRLLSALKEGKWPGLPQ